MKRLSPAVGLTLCGVFALVAVALAPAIGRVRIDAIDAILQTWRGVDTPETRVLALRLPRILLGFVGGATLAVAGASMQTLLRNPLATPYTLGVSFAGAAGAFLALSLPGIASRFGSTSPTAVFALVFTLADVAFLARLLRARVGRSTNELLLAGVTLNFVFGAAILLMRFLADPLRLRAMDRWMMGGLQVGSLSELAAIPVLLLPALVVLLFLSRSLDQLSMGEELAATRGIDVARTQRMILIASSVATAAIVSVTGPIGFVGLLVPHAARVFLGASHAVLLAGCALLGGGFLVLADSAARAITISGRGSELPVGVLTALVGGPLFLTLLLRMKNGRS